MKILLILLLLTVNTNVFAASFVTIPYNFIARQLISASKVMANYNALKNSLIDGTKKINIAEVWISGTKRINSSGILVEDNVYKIPGEYSSLGLAVTAVGSKTANIFIDTETSESTGVNVPSNVVSLEFGPKGMINGFVTVTLNNQHIEAKDGSQIFGDNLTVTGSISNIEVAGESLLSEWTGGSSADGLTVAAVNQITVVTVNATIIDTNIIDTNIIDTNIITTNIIYTTTINAAVSVNGITIEDVVISNGVMTSPTINYNESVNPVGTIIMFGAETPPPGYFMCDGSELNRITNAALFNVIGTSWGSSSESTFNLPDLRGQFPRGWDNGAGIDPEAGFRTSITTGGNTGNHVGSYQEDEFESHQHAMASVSSIAGGGSNPTFHSSGTFFTGSTGGNETRPKNVYVNYCIKY